MRIALIKNGIVENIAEFDKLSEAQAITADMGVTAGPVDDLPVQIGDSFMEGNYYREDEIVLPVPKSEFQELDDLRQCILELSQQLYGEESL